MDDSDFLAKALEFHGHRCWASVAGVRAGLAARRVLGVPRSGGTQLFGVVEIGEEHGGMCFGDGVQYATGCTLGKGNLRRNPLGKLAVTLTDKATERAVRVSYKPTLQPQIAQSAFMRQRAEGTQPDEIPEADQLALVSLIWDAPEEDVLTIGKVITDDTDWLPEVMGFLTCSSCLELTALAYVRVVGETKVCIPCSGYER